MSTFAPLLRRVAVAALALAAGPAAGQNLTDPECQGPVHGRTRDVGEALTVTMVSGTVAPGTRGFVCVPWAVGSQTGLRLAREVVVVAAWSDQVRTRVTKRSGTNLVPDAAVTFERVERHGSVTIDVDAGRAQVWAGGARLGGTPFVIPLPEGTYAFEIRRPGYETVQREVAVRAGAPSVERVSLVPAGDASRSAGVARGGALRVTSTPPGARVWIDGAEVGVTPYTASALTLGPHEVEVNGDTLTAPAQLVEVSARPQTLAVVLDVEPGYLLIRTDPPGLPVAVERGEARATPVLVAAASGTRSVQAQGAGVRALASTVDVRPGLLTVAAVPAEAAAGWIDVAAPAAATVFLGAVEVGRGSLRLRVPAGEHTLAVQSGGQDLVRQTVRVEDGGAVAVAAAGVAGVAEGAPAVAEGGAVAVVDLPDAPAAPPALPPVAVATPVGVPVSMPVGALPAGPAARQGPWSTGTGAADPPCAAVPAARLADEAEDRLYGGAYDAARACLIRLAQLDPGQASYATQRVTDIGQARATLEIRPADAALVRSYHAQMLQFAASGDLRRLVSTGPLLFQALPSDPAGLLILRRALGRSFAVPGTDVQTAAVYVPGATEQLPDEPGLLSVPNPPQTGFLLATTETTNRAFVTFLNTLDPSDARPLLVRRTRFVERATERYLDGRRQRTREVFRVAEGADELPAVDATWAGADAYARWAGGRLPTMAEWVWAMRMGRRARVATGGHLLTATRARAPVAVRSYPADGVGLHDMLGNVWEWVGPDAPSRPNLLRAGGGSYTTDPASLERTLFRTFGSNDHDDQTGWRVLFAVE